MSKKLSHVEIQEVSIAVLADVHDFCVRNNIDYSLAYGSLIGAIRHEGFIPWDDDIDIVMTRPDYERFCKEYKSANCVLITPEHSYINYARVCDITRTTHKTYSPWTNDNVGVWIDIFPLDGVEDEREKFSERINKLKPLLDLQVNGRIAKKAFCFSINPKRLLKQIYTKYKYSKVNLCMLKSTIDSIAQEIPFGSTQHCSQLVCRGNGDKEFFTLDMFNTYSLVRFVNYSFLIANGWKKMLEMNYKNYMQLPPKEEQKPHGGFASFFWK